MRIVSRGAAGSTGTAGAGTRRGTAIGVAAALLALAASSASAAPSSVSSGAASASFCGTAHGVAQDILDSTSITRGSLTPAATRARYEAIKAAEPALLRSASPPIKAELKPVFRFVNLLIVDFTKTGWEPSGLVQYTPTLLPAAAHVKQPLRALQAYFKTTCKLKV
jgi:hypothetical protein